MTTIAYCRHDMQIVDGVSTCADCRGLPDVPILDDDPIDSRKSLYAHYGPDRDRRGVLRDACATCSRCGDPIPGAWAWSATDAGLICADCGDLTD